MKTFRYYFDLPIYPAGILVSVSDDLAKSRIRENKRLGVDGDIKEDQPSCFGLHCWLDHEFGIFMRCGFTHGQLAHEIFHSTHRILEAVGVRFKPGNHEPFTYVNQYLTNRIYRELKRAKIKINS